MKKTFIVSVFFLVLCALQVYAEQPVASQGIKPKDTLKISVEGQADLSKTVTVSEKGAIRYPLLGEINLNGLSVSQAEQEMTEQFRRYYFIESKVSIEDIPYQRKEETQAPTSFPSTSSKESTGSSLTADLQNASEQPETLIERSSVPTYKITAYDTLQISVYGEPDLSVTVKVSDENTIRYALLGEIEVGGLTADEVAKKIEGLLKKGYMLNPQVSVFIEEHGKVYIFGEVNQPGSYELKGALTLVDVIVLAGGLKENANQSRIKVIRVYKDPKEPKPIKEYVIDLETHGKDFYLQPLDKIIVEKYGSLYVVGAVKNPGVFKLEKIDLTPFDAITFLAGGALENANLSKVVIVREENGVKKEYVFDLANEKKQDFFLKEEDRIVVNLYKNISVFGQVRKSGSFPYTKDMTVTDAISLAGGFTDVANTNGVRVIRGEGKTKKTIKVPVGYVLKTGDKTRDLILDDGDIIVVPESWL
jgi:polysaccharide export outer membrane protein